MNRTEFNKELEKLFDSIRQKFLVKGDEYVEHFKSKLKNELDK